MILACECDENGSEDQLCDKDSGQCTCSTLVSIRSTGLSKCQWRNKFKPAATSFPLDDCKTIQREEWPNNLRNAFQQVTFGRILDVAETGNAQHLGSAICHVLSYEDIRTYVCDHLNSYFNLRGTNQNNGWLQYSTVHPLSIPEIHLK